MKPKKFGERITVSLPDELYLRLRKEAALKRCSTAELIREALSEYSKVNSKSYAKKAEER